jgi:hypothetical protein
MNNYISPTSELARINSKIQTLFDAIKHGDEDHQAWLKEAIRCHFEGLPMPEYVAGKPSTPEPDVYPVNRMTVDLAGNTPEETAVIQNAILRHVILQGAHPCPGCNYVHTHCRCKSKSDKISMGMSVVRNEDSFVITRYPILGKESVSVVNINNMASQPPEVLEAIRKFQESQER